MEYEIPFRITCVSYKKVFDLVEMAVVLSALRKLETERHVRIIENISKECFAETDLLGKPCRIEIKKEVIKGTPFFLNCSLRRWNLYFAV